MDTPQRRNRPRRIQPEEVEKLEMLAIIRNFKKIDPATYEDPPPQRPTSMHPGPLRPAPPRPVQAAVQPAMPIPVATRPASRFKQVFNVSALDQLKKATDRGLLNKGSGGFGKLVDAAKEFLQGTPQTSAAEVRRIQPFVDKVQTYLDERPVATDPNDGGKRVFKNQEVRVKITTAERMLMEAKHLQQDLIDADFPAAASSDPAVREPVAQGRAAAMAATFGIKKPSGGTSTGVYLIKSSGGIGYAFKSVDGEAVQTGMPPGSAAMREALSSRVAETIRAGTGLDFGFPQVSLVSLGGKQGALIEGMPGDVLDDEDLMHIQDDDRVRRRARDKNIAPHVAAAELEREYQAQRKFITEQADKVPAAQLQKVLLNNLATAQFDIKWGNMMLSDDGAGACVARPFDAGAAFPPDALFADFLERGAQPGLQLLFNPGSRQPLKAATEAMDGALVDQFLSIDTAELQQVLDEERLRIARVHGFDPALLDDSAAARALNSVTLVQDILAKDRTISLEGFVDAYFARIGELK